MMVRTYAARPRPPVQSLGYSTADGTTTDRNTWPYTPQPGAIDASASPTVVVTPTSGPIPPPTAVPAAAAPATNPLMAWLQGSMFGGIPNWMLAAGAAVFFLMESGGKK